MLARSAQGLYWMSRYLERTQHLCRLLMLQSEALVDRPIHEINFGWRRIYASVGRLPPSGDIEIIDSDEFTLADSYALAEDLTFEDTNPFCAWNCFAAARENARQIRRYISAEMWACLNMAYLRLRNATMRDVWRNSPESFYANMASEIDTFSGIATTTMYRDEGWNFLRLGQFIERAQLLSSLMLAQIELDEITEEHSTADWIGILRMYHAVEAYSRQFNVEVEPESALDVLTTDELLPESLIRSLDRARFEIRSIGAGPDSQASDSIRRLAGRLSSMLHYEWPDRSDKKDMLTRVNTLCRELHQFINDTYFEYSSEDIPRRL